MKKGEWETEPVEIERPYPLLRNFGFYVLPLLLVGVIGLTWSMRETIAVGIEAFHAEREQNNARTIIDAAYTADPEGWNDMVAGASGDLRPKLLSELSEVGIFCMSIQSADGRLIYDATVGEACRVPSIATFHETLEDGRPQLIENLALAGHWTSLMYLRDPADGRSLLVSASRPSSALETTVGALSLTPTLIFGGMFLIACALALGLTWRAQGRLNISFEAQNRARIAMQPFLSRNARANLLKGRLVATQHSAVVMFADLRNFSGYAETATMEEIASLLDEFVTIMARTVEQHGGDVDKNLGDGVLAWFKGENANENAIKASVACIDGCHDLVRRPGIGLFPGEVIAATLGRGERMDFTILGRSVNLASRLCSVARENEIAAPASMTGFQDVGLVLLDQEISHFKNHAEPLPTRRYLRQPGASED